MKKGERRINGKLLVLGFALFVALILFSYFVLRLTGFVTLEEVTNESATIGFDSVDARNSTIDYGESLGFGFTKVNSSFVVNHSERLTGLSSGTLYYYNITTCNSTGFCEVEGPYEFTTAGVEGLFGLWILLRGMGQS